MMKKIYPKYAHFMSFLIQDPVPKPNPPHIEQSLGIDFGTTFCCVATCNDKGQAKVLGPLIPSRLSYHSHTVQVGHDCPEENPETLHSIKRFMDSNTAYAPQADKKWHSRSPFQAATDLFYAIKQQSIDALGVFVPHAVVTVPAYFDENKRQTIKKAAEQAGFTVMRLISEPTAAALCYHLKTEGIYGVYDLGGGTFDFSILKMQKDFFRVLATGGHPAMGGDTIDHNIAKILFPNDPMGHIKARIIKEDGKQNQIDLQPIIRPIAQNTIAICDQTLHDAGLKRSDLKALILVGGATKMPALVRHIRHAFSQTIDQDLDPDRSIAKGAAIYARHLTHESPFLLLDVTPLSLGIETQGGLVERLIERNTPLPFEKEMLFTTGQKDQRAIKIHVVQGEGQIVDNCHSLGSFDITSPTSNKERTKIMVKFVLDVDGLLTVSATDIASGKKHSIMINPAQGLNSDIVKKQISSEGHDIWDRIWAQKVYQIKTAIAEIQRLLKQRPCPDIEKACAEMDAIYALKDMDLLEKKWNTLSAMALPLFEQSMTHWLKRTTTIDRSDFDT